MPVRLAYRTRPRKQAPVSRRNDRLPELPTPDSLALAAHINIIETLLLTTVFSVAPFVVLPHSGHMI